jgi:hypothetical protein
MGENMIGVTTELNRYAHRSGNFRYDQANIHATPERGSVTALTRTVIVR